MVTGAVQVVPSKVTTFPPCPSTAAQKSLAGHDTAGQEIPPSPMVRPPGLALAGALQVPVRTFTLWQVVGGLVWSLGLTLAGYALGSSIPNVDRYLLPIIAVIIVVSLIPLAAELRRSRRAAATERGAQG